MFVKECDKLGCRLRICREYRPAVYRCDNIEADVGTVYLKNACFSTG
jgi:hypothetical protein